MIVIFAIASKSSISFCTENKRFMPLIGLNLSIFGFIGSKEIFHFTCIRKTMTVKANKITKKGNAMISMLLIASPAVAQANCNVKFVLV